MPVLANMTSSSKPSSKTTDSHRQRAVKLNLVNFNWTVNTERLSVLHFHRRRKLFGLASRGPTTLRPLWSDPTSARIYFITNISFNLLVKEFVKIGEHFSELQAKWPIASYAPFALNVCSQRCRTHQKSKTTCV